MYRVGVGLGVVWFGVLFGSGGELEKCGVVWTYLSGVVWEDGAWFGGIVG